MDLLKKILDIFTFERYIFGMKIRYSLILVILVMFTSAFAGAFLEFFNARTEGENVKLEWKSGTEESLKNYIIERKTPQSGYYEIATVAPEGSNSFYSYIDESVYKPSTTVFTYRLKIVGNEITYSKDVSVSPNVSGVKRTWGSIKAMFR